jgi:hypothetical protein
MSEFLEGWCTCDGAAQLCGLQPATWRAYARDGHAPAPEAKLGTLNLWRVETVLEWRDHRPGPGWWGPHPGPREMARRRTQRQDVEQTSAGRGDVAEGEQ